MIKVYIYNRFATYEYYSTVLTVICEPPDTRCFFIGGMMTKTKKKIVKIPNNEFTKCGNYTEIIIIDLYGDEKSRAQIDNKDVKKCINHKWREDKKGYIVGRVDGKDCKLHRYLLNAPDDKQVDHRNNDKKNNRRYNLRLCNNSQNHMNKGLQRNNTSGYTGVCYNKASSKWEARIKVNGKDIYLGRSTNKAITIELRRLAEIEYFGEFRNNKAV